MTNSGPENTERNMPEDATIVIATIRSLVGVYYQSTPLPSSLSEELDSPGGFKEIVALLEGVEDAIDAYESTFPQVRRTAQKQRQDAVGPR